MRVTIADDETAGREVGDEPLRVLSGSGVILIVNASARLSSLAIILTFAGCNRDFELPPEIASSKYITYHTDADASVVCMDDFLAREDRFVERTAMLLGVGPPTETVHFIWDLEQDGKEPWACDDNVNCYKHLDGGRFRSWSRRVP